MQELVQLTWDSAKNSSELNKFLHSEVNLLIQHGIKYFIDGVRQLEKWKVLGKSPIVLYKHTNESWSKYMSTFRKEHGKWTKWADQESDCWGVLRGT